MVQVLADAGMRVAILDLDGAAAESVAVELSAKGVATLACRADVRDRASLDAAAAAVAERFGTCNVLCAHVGGGALGAFDSFSIDDWREAFETMVIGTLNTVHAFLPLLRQAVGLRRVVLTASAAALAPGSCKVPTGQQRAQ
jgi:NAD(P)-dependent dehydrogenase (short-subunit alcohol dehydrogenase family)